MKSSIPTDMQADLDGRATTHCMCWAIEATGGTKLGFTDHDKDLIFRGITFKASTGISASALSQTKNLSIDDVEALGVLDDASITATDIAGGIYDGAIITIWKVDWTDVCKRVVLTRGVIGTVSRGNTGYQVQVESLSSMAQHAVGRVYGPKCNREFGDEKCGANLAPYTQSGDAIASTSQRVFQSSSASFLANASGYYSRGKLIWTSGANIGLEFRIRYSSQDGINTIFELAQPVPNPIQAGDTFDAIRGCPKTDVFCNDEIGNLANFRGFNRTPKQDFMLNYPVRRELNDGSSLYQ